MKANCTDSESNMMAREKFNSNFGDVYSAIGQQDMMEQNAMPQMKAYAEERSDMDYGSEEE